MAPLVTSASMIFLFFSNNLVVVMPILLRWVYTLAIQSFALDIATLICHYSFSSTFLQTNITMFFYSTCLLICSSAAKLAHDTSLATFLILWSGSSTKNTVSVITKNISFRFLLLLNFSNAESNWVFFCSWQGKTPQWGFDSQMLISYYAPKWKRPYIRGTLTPSFLSSRSSSCLPLFFKRFPMKAGIC